MMKSCRDKALQALLQGRGCANQLKRWLDDPKADQGSVSSEDLAETVLACFSDALSVFIQDTTCVDHSYVFSPNMSPPPPPTPLEKHQRNSPERRKISDKRARSDNWREDLQAPNYYDGFLWRKYGQKTIKHSDHHRSYYRCAYAGEHQCDAKKHVQKIQDNPPVYRTSYFGHHTCRIYQDSTFPVVEFNHSDDFGGAQMIKFDQDSSFSDSSSSAVEVDHEKKIVKEEAAEEQMSRNRDEFMREGSSSPSDSCRASSFLIDGLDLLDDFEHIPFEFDFESC